MADSVSDVGRFPCAQCGAQLQYQPGTTHMKCPYCGFEQAIAPPAGKVQELPYQAYLDRATLDVTLETDASVRCDKCGAQYSVPANQETKDCPFCGSRVIVPVNLDHRIPANGVLPFVLREQDGRGKLGEWLGTRFWAPNDLKAMALKDGRLRGMYIPYWTFNCDTQTQYSGMRGEAYYVEVEYTDTDANGNAVTRTRTERRINWYPAAGTVEVPFEDVLVLASASLPQEQARRLHEWDLVDLVPYDPKWLMGFQTMRYDVDLNNGFTDAQQVMSATIDGAIRVDIGGDEQQILSKNTQYFDVTFKHILLPIYVGGFQYRGKAYRIVVNGRSGEVQGEAPISVWKVLIAVLLGLVILGVILYLYGQRRS